VFATRADRKQWLLAWSHGLAAELAAWRGELDEAASQLEAALVPLAAEPWGPALNAWYRGLRASVRAGQDPTAARELLARLSSQVERQDRCRRDRSWPSHLEGALLEAEGAFGRALAAYEDALVDRGRHRPAPLVADAQLGLARCRLALGDAETARSHAQAAVDRLARWPGWRKAEAETLLRRLGGGPAVDGPQVLTPREREVAVLVAEGLSNGEIGRCLFVSAKTASVHVSNILGKLGMSSRAEIAAWAVRQGLRPV